MKRVLHLITGERDSLSEQIIHELGKDPDSQQEIVRLAGGESAAEIETPPDYAELVEKVFAADAVHIW